MTMYMSNYLVVTFQHACLGKYLFVNYLFQKINNKSYKLYIWIHSFHKTKDNIGG